MEQSRAAEHQIETIKNSFRTDSWPGTRWFGTHERF